MALSLGPRVGCIVLAAGQSKRFGGAKLLAPVLGKLLIQHAIDAATASAALTCTLVLGARAEDIRERVDPRRCATALNERWRDGIASSIRFGLRERADDHACIIMLADQPFVSAADLDALIRAHAAVPRSIVALRAGLVWGTPALFVRRDFARLRALRGDHGAKSYIKTQSERLVFVDAQDRRAFTDVDRREDLTTIGVVPAALSASDDPA